MNFLLHRVFSCKKAQVLGPGICIGTVIHGSQNCLPAYWLLHSSLHVSGHLQQAMQSPSLPIGAGGSLSWEGPHGWWRGVGISPSSSIRPLLEQETANVESRCASGGNQVCRRLGKEAQSSLRGQHLPHQTKLHAPNKTPSQQQPAHQPPSPLPRPLLIQPNAAGSSLAFEVPRDISRDRAEDAQQQDVPSSCLNWELATRAKGKSLSTESLAWGRNLKYFPPPLLTLW